MSQAIRDKVRLLCITFREIGQYILNKMVFLLDFNILIATFIDFQVDEYMNCEDLAFNFLVSHITRQPPIKVKIHRP